MTRPYSQDEYDKMWAVDDLRRAKNPEYRHTLVAYDDDGVSISVVNGRWQDQKYVITLVSNHNELIDFKEDILDYCYITGGDMVHQGCILEADNCLASLFTFDRYGFTLSYKGSEDKPKHRSMPVFEYMRAIQAADWSFLNDEIPQAPELDF